MQGALADTIHTPPGLLCGCGGCGLGKLHQTGGKAPPKKVSANRHTHAPAHPQLRCVARGTRVGVCRGWAVRRGGIPARVGLPTKNGDSSGAVRCGLPVIGDLMSSPSPSAWTLAMKDLPVDLVAARIRTHTPGIGVTVVILRTARLHVSRQIGRCLIAGSRASIKHFMVLIMASWISGQRSVSR